jgi:ketosteroid isomerase-like protein
MGTAAAKQTENSNLEENKQLVRRFCAAMEKDMIGCLDLLTDDMQWWLPLLGTVTKEDCKRNNVLVQEQFASPLKLEIKTLTAEENRVAAEIESYVKLKNGKIYNNKYHVLFRVRDGKIYEVREHNDSHHAYEIFSDLLVPKS